MRYYDEIAAGYDELYAAEQLDKLTSIAAFLKKEGIEIDSSWSLLDVGCGTGISTAFFPCQEKKGIDTSKKLLARAQEKFPAILFEEGSAEKLKEKRYDLVISLTALQNFNDPVRCLTAMLGVGKHFIFSVLAASPKTRCIREHLLPLGFKELQHHKDTIFIKF